jgi:hypothetical protein
MVRPVSAEHLASLFLLQVSRKPNLPGIEPGLKE